MHYCQRLEADRSKSQKCLSFSHTCFLEKKTDLDKESQARVIFNVQCFFESPSVLWATLLLLNHHQSSLMLVTLLALSLPSIC